MSIPEIPTAITKKRTSRGWLHLRLDTLLLLVTLAAVGTAYFKARATRQDWQLRLNRLEMATGLPSITDISQAEVAGLNFGTNRKYSSWYVWVPHGQSTQIRIATNGFAQEFPERYDSFKLGPGRHRLAIKMEYSNSKTMVLVDDEVIWERAFDSRWNIAYPWTYSLSAKGTKFPKSPELIFFARGNLRLKADEEFKPEMLDFGLKVWLVK